MEKFYLEFFDRDYQMYVEGSSDTKSVQSEIFKKCAHRGYYAFDFDWMFDTMMQFYRFTANIEPLVTADDLAAQLEGLINATDAKDEATLPNAIMNAGAILSNWKKQNNGK